eukprot:6473051-Amphidinium_carterae.1
MGTVLQEAECLSNGQIEQTPLHSNSVQPDPSGHTRQFHREEAALRSFLAVSPRLAVISALDA